MNYQEYEKLYQLENTYWWHIGRQSIIGRLMGLVVKRTPAPCILDVGCGTGGMLGVLGSFGGEVYGLDYSAAALSFCQQRGWPAQFLFEGRAEALPFGNNHFEVVSMFDLLEHLSDDLAALNEAHRVLKPGGWLLLTVPAYPWLWGEHDEALGHQRRYRVQDLKSKICEAGFTIEKLTFAVSILLPPIILYRGWRKIWANSPSHLGAAEGESRRVSPQTSYVILPKTLNQTFVKVLKLEGWLIPRISLPFGASIICLARRGK